MKAVLTLAGIGLVAAAAAVLLGTSRVALTPRERPLRLEPAGRPEPGRGPRRRCVRLGWKAPYWYAGVSDGRHSNH